MENHCTLQILEQHAISVGKCIDAYRCNIYKRTSEIDHALGLCKISSEHLVKKRYSALQQRMNAAWIMKQVAMGFASNELVGDLDEQMNRLLKNALYCPQVAVEMNTLHDWIKQKSIRTEDGKSSLLKNMGILVLF